MERNKAKKLAEIITSVECKEMLEKARQNIKKWDVPSRVNPQGSRGALFNIFAKIDWTQEQPPIVKVNAIREFGEFLPKKYLVKPTKQKLSSVKMCHQEPIAFGGFSDNGPIF